MEVEFFEIVDFPMYEISKCGRVRNKTNGYEKSIFLNDIGYPMVHLTKNKISKPKRLHRLLAKNFIPNPNNYKYVNHLDGNKANHSLDNLEWCTHKQNMQHAFRTGLANNTGTKNGMSKLTPEKVIEIKRLLKSGMSQYKIAEKIGGISRSTVLKIKLGKMWNHIKE